MPKFYCTTPAYYTNDVAHLGHAYTTIATDVIARWQRLKIGKENVMFITGLDEHGAKMERAARERGMTPQEFVDMMAKKFKKTWKILNISYNGFIRTSEERHIEVVKKIFKRIFDVGDIYKGIYEDWYCVPCESYWTETQLENGKCPTCKGGVEKLKEESYFFRLSKYQNKLLNLYKKNPDFVLPEHRRNEIINRVKGGLKDLSVSRTKVKWGIPVPIDKKLTLYCWLDALNFYISVLDYPGPKFKRFWPPDLQLMAKEINWFHSVIFPALLMSAKLPIPKKLFIHGWLTVNGEKMSKSKGNFVIPEGMVDKYGVDAFRYHLIREIPFGSDGDFSELALIRRVNDELADNYGNLFYRVTSFIEKNFDSVPEPGKVGAEERELERRAKEVIEEVEKSMEKLDLGRALNSIMELSGETNKYFQYKKPWEKMKKDKSDVQTTLYYSVNVLRTISNLLIPFIPESAGRALKALNVKPDKPENLKKFGIKAGHKIKPKILFRKIKIEEEDPFSRVDLKVAKVLSVKDHPEADKLYVLKIDLGAEKRQIVAGLKGHYKKEKLVGKNIIVLTNLKKIKLRGEESNGMLLAVESGDKIGLILSKDKPGSDVFAEGVEKKPVGVLDLKDFLKLGLVSRRGKVFYKDKVLKTDVSEISVDGGVEGRVC